MSRMRIDKFLSEMKIATRAECKKMITAGRIRNGETVLRDPGEKIDPDMDKILVDGNKVIYEKYQYIMLYKPAGCVTATKDNLHKTVMDYLPKDRREGLSPVGRLDKDTEGLLLITDDGDLNHGLLSPKKHVNKTYFAKVDGPVSETEVEAFARGLDIGEKNPTAPAKLEVLSSEEVLVTITEGKFHQVKRMFEAVGMHVLYLKRISMGPLCLDESLQPGEWRMLKPEEIEELKESTNVKR